MTCYNATLTAIIAGFFKGTSADQDRRFSDKELKLLKTMKFPPEFEKKVGLRGLIYYKYDSLLLARLTCGRSICPSFFHGL